MSFQRALRWFFLITGFVGGLAGALAVFLSRLAIRPPRQRLWATPADLGMAYEDVQFPAQDGVRLSGWFIPATASSRQKGATIIIVHGWLWNRLGAAADDLLSRMSGMTPVDLLRFAHSLHEEGFNLFMFDLRNHGESAMATPVTFGRREADDLLGALAHVRSRSEVNTGRIGLVGFSTGANVVLYTLPRTTEVQAAVVVQPTSMAIFLKRYSAYMLGPLGYLVLPLAELLYRAAGGPALASMRPSMVAAGIDETPVLFVQGEGDDWGTTEDVAAMAAATPQGRGPLFVETADRAGGYQYVVDRPGIVTAFLEQHLPETA